MSLPEPAECQCDPPVRFASRLHGYICRRCLLPCPPPVTGGAPRGRPTRPPLPMPRRYPVMLDYYVDPAEFTPNTEQLDCVENLLDNRRFHEGRRGVAMEVMTLLWYMGWRPVEANRFDDLNAKRAAERKLRDHRVQE